MPTAASLSLGSLIAPARRDRTLACRAAGRASRFAAGDERDDFGDRRIGGWLRLRLAEPFGKRARTEEQRLIERTDEVQPLPGELAPPHADDVQPFERGVLAGDKAIRDDVAAHAAGAGDHRLRADPHELMHRAQARRSTRNHRPRNDRRASPSSRRSRRCRPCSRGRHGCRPSGSSDRRLASGRRRLPCPY